MTSRTWSPHSIRGESDEADYDSQADALSIDLLDVPRWDDGEEIDDTYCNVALYEGRPANVELLNSGDHPPNRSID